MNIRIAGTEFSLTNKSFEIYVQGCYRNCSGCHNPDTQPFNGGKEVDIEKFIISITDKIYPFKDLVKNIYVSGGDLLCYPHKVAEAFSNTLAYYTRHTLWLFTGEEEDKIPKWVWFYYDIVKCGKYDNTLLNPEGSFPASSNQKLIFNSNNKYKLQSVFDDTEFLGEKKWK